MRGAEPVMAGAAFDILPTPPMRSRFRITVAALLALATAACSDRSPVAPDVATPVAAPRTVLASSVPDIRITEIHYDDSGTDSGEAIEVAAPATEDLSGWRLVLYNGASASAAVGYPTSGGQIVAYPLAEGTVSGVVTTRTVCTAAGRQVIVVSFPVDGIQNGPNDGVALVNAQGSVVELLSYEGTFTASNGPAAGLTSTGIGVAETGSEGETTSLKRDAQNVWRKDSPRAFGACDADIGGGVVDPVVVASVTIAPAAPGAIDVGGTQQFTAEAFDANGGKLAGVSFAWTTSDPTVATITQGGLATGAGAGTATISASAGGKSASATLTVTQPPPPDLPVTRLAELHYDNTGTDVLEKVEIEGPAGTDLTGWSVVLYNGNGGGVYRTDALAGSIPATCGARGVVVVEYPQDGIQNGGPDGLALVNAQGAVVEFLSYEGTFTATDGPAQGTTSKDIGASEATAPQPGRSLQRNAMGQWTAPAPSSFGLCNGVGTPPAVTSWVSFTGRSASDAPLPIGFQDQIFGNLGGPGAPPDATIAFSALTPSLASIDARGVVTALGAGTAVFRATASNGATATLELPLVQATAGAAQYRDHLEFGLPTDADASDDYILRRTEFVSSFSGTRNTPNWVSYNLNATHIAPGQDRCDCFTYDPLLPASFTRYTTADYTGSAAITGMRIDRGHLARSFDRTSGSLDNARSFYFSNIIPQASDMNQGPWSRFETYLGDLALQGKEVYIVTGVAGNIGTVRNEGLIVVPASAWKVAVILPQGQGLGSVTSLAALQVVAVIMPNVNGILSAPWENYETTVDAVELLSGYDLLSLLRDDIEIAVESRTKPPVAAVNGPFVSAEGATLAMSGAASSDPDGDALTYAWSFGDGATATGASVTHTYVQDGSYTVRLIVTDPRGLADTTVTTATIANVVPVVNAFAGATLLPGEQYAATGSFLDAGTDPWTATVDYGDGGGVRPLALSGRSFSLSHVYATPGTFTVTVRVSDDDASSVRTQTVTVLSPAQGIALAIAQAEALGTAGRLDAQDLKSVVKTLENAAEHLAKAQSGPTINLLEAALHDLDKAVRSGGATASAVAELRSTITRVIASLSR